MLQPTRYWPEVRRPDGARRIRRRPAVRIAAENPDIAYGIVHDAIGKLSFSEAKAVLSLSTGQWARVQDTWKISGDEALTADRRIANIVDAYANLQRLVASPVKFDHDPAALARAPQFAKTARRRAPRTRNRRR